MLYAMIVMEPHTVSAMKDTSKRTQRTAHVEVGAVDLFGNILDKHVILYSQKHYKIFDQIFIFLIFSSFQTVEMALNLLMELV